MKKVLILALAIVLIVGSAFAGGGRQAAPGEGYRDTLIWAQASDVTNIDPHIGRETTAIQVFTQMYDTLTQRCPATGNILPSLATHWEQITPTSFRFHIRQGVRFHDGTTLTAEDVKFSLDRALRLPTSAFVVDWIREVTVESRYVVRIDKIDVFGPMLLNLAIPFTAIVPKHHVERDDNILATRPIGTGPFRFVHWRHGVEVEMVAFEDHWRGPPATRRLIMRVIPEGTQRVIALETGEIDLVYEIPPIEVSRLRRDRNIQVHEIPGFGIHFLVANTTRPHLGNPLVRRAISHAIDRQLIVDTIMAGTARPADQTASPAVFGYYSTGVHRFDPALSRQLLAQAGFPHGFEINILSPPHQERRDTVEAIVEMLRDVGITASMEVIEFGSFVMRVNVGEHDLAFWAFTTITGDADYVYYTLNHSSLFGHAGNRSFINLPELDALLMRGKHSVDNNYRIQVYREIARKLDELAPQIPLHWTNIIVASRDRVVGFVPDPAGYHWHFNTRVRN